MRLIAPAGVGLAPLPGRLNYPGHTLTLIAKLKLRLVPGSTAQIETDRPSFPTGDELYPDDPEGTRAPRYESDYAHFKPSADVLVVGHFHAPEQKPVKAGEVAIGVGNRSMRLMVIGRRRWLGSGRLPDASQAEPFTTLPLRWEHAFGGPGHQQNPTGSGYVAPESASQSALAARDFSRAPLEMPRIERPDKLLSYLDQPLDPVCFAPRARSWPWRRHLIGTCDERWLGTRWPWFPEDFDARYFQAALPGLQQREYLRGDEVLRARNMHPSIGEYRCQLPGVRALAAVQRIDAEGGGRFELVPMNLDTLWIDMDAEVAQLVWRGSCPAKDAEASDIAYAWSDLAPLALELTAEQIVARASQAVADEEAKWAMEPEAEPVALPASPAKAATAAPALDPELAAILAQLPAPQELPVTPLSPAQQAKLDAAIQQVEADLEAQRAAREEEQAKRRPKPWTRERVRETRGQKGSLAGVDLSGLDLRGEDLAGVDLSGTLLDGARLDGASLQGAILRGASLRGASLHETDLTCADLADADLSRSQASGVRVERAQLPRANLSQCSWEQVRFLNVNLEECHALGARFTEATFVGAKLDEADFGAAQLPGATFEGLSALSARFVEAALPSATFTDCALQQADFEGALLTQLRCTRCVLDDATLEAADATGAQLTDCTIARLRAEGARFGFAQWSNLVGKDAVLVASVFHDARLVACTLLGGDFSAAQLARATVRGCQLKRAKFAQADLREALLLGCDCFEATFEGARLGRCDGGHSSFFRAEFLDAEVSDFYGHERDLLGTKLAAKG